MSTGAPVLPRQFDAELEEERGARGAERVRRPAEQVGQRTGASGQGVQQTRGAELALAPAARSSAPLRPVALNACSILTMWSRPRFAANVSGGPQLLGLPSAHVMRSNLPYL